MGLKYQYDVTIPYSSGDFFGRGGGYSGGNNNTSVTIPYSSGDFFGQSGWFS